MKKKKRVFVQNLYHEIEGDSAEEYLNASLPLIGSLVMTFNGLEKELDAIICDLFTDTTDSIGMIVIHNMAYSTKVDMFKRFSDELHNQFEETVDCYEILIHNLKQSGKLRNLVVHADWENTDHEGYTYVNMKISRYGMLQEYVQFSEKSLRDIIHLIIETRKILATYWDHRKKKLFYNPVHW